MTPDKVLSYGTRLTCIVGYPQPCYNTVWALAAQLYPRGLFKCHSLFCHSVSAEADSMLDSGESKNPATHACACTSCTYLVLSCRLLGRDIARGRRHGPALGRVAADARTRARARVVLLPLVARLVLLVLVLLVDVRTEGDHCLPVNCGYDCTGVLEGVVVVVMTGVVTVVLTDEGRVSW